MNRRDFLKNVTLTAFGLYVPTKLIFDMGAHTGLLSWKDYWKDIESTDPVSTFEIVWSKEGQALLDKYNYHVTSGFEYDWSKLVILVQEHYQVQADGPLHLPTGFKKE